MACSGGGCGGCGNPDPIDSSRQAWRTWMFLLALGGVLVFMASR